MNNNKPTKKQTLGMTLVLFIFYFLLWIVTEIPSNTDFATLAFPVVFYLVVNIIIRNRFTDIEVKRLSDLIDSAVISYVVIYLFIGIDINFILLWLLELIGIGICSFIIFCIGSNNKNSGWYKKN